MNIRFLNQPKEVQMGAILKDKLQDSFEEVWIVSGIAKDSAIEFLEEELKIATKKGTQVNVYVGVDRKNTSKDVLLKVIDAGASLGIHVNGENSKVETRMYVFESSNKESYVYLSGGKFSEGGLTENTCFITEIKYDVSEKESFQAFKNQMMQAISIFKLVDKEDITLLAMKGEIVSRIIDRKIPSISELYGNSEQVIGEQVYDEGVGLGIIKEEDFDDFEIEFDEGMSLRKNVELEAEKEAKIDAFAETNKTKEDLDRLLGIEKEQKESKKARIIKDLTDSDYAKMTTLIIEAGKIAGGEIKIQKGLASLIESFMNPNTNGNITLEIMDNQTGEEETVVAELKDNGKGISLKTERISVIEPQETDILRIIKSAADKYRLEIIREGTPEHAIWNQYLTNNVKGSKRRYGIL